MSKRQAKDRRFLTLLFCLFLGGSLFLLASPAEASGFDENKVKIHLGTREIERGYTIDKPDGEMRLAIFPHVLDRPADIKLEKIPAEGLLSPSNLKRVSDVFEFDIVTQPIKIFGKEVIIVLTYQSDNNKTKKIYFYDRNQKKWRPLYSQTNYKDHWVRAYTHLPYSQIAVFEEDFSEEGYASWYRSSRYPYGCASNNYPLNTQLKVTSLEDKSKSVICTVKSTGPFDRSRIIDLSLTAFRQLAPSWRGLVKVHVESVSGHVLGDEDTNDLMTQKSEAPALTAPVAMIYDADHFKVIYEKNSYRHHSIASITKLMTTIIFLETKPDFEKIITIEDSDLPRPEAGVRIAVNPGDKISIRDLFNAMITGSANNAALALVRSTGMTQEEFVKKMNAKAMKLNMMSTHFADPTGLSPNNTSTSTDVAILINYIMHRPGVRLASIQPTYTYYIINKDEHRTIKNPLYLYSSLLTNEPIVGAKTGFINEAGYCLVTQIKHPSGREFQAVIFGSSSPYTRVNDMKKLIDYGLKIF